MAAERLSMRKVREVLRLHFEKALSSRAIARSCKISASTVQGYIERARTHKLVWPTTLDDTALERLLFPGPLAGGQRRPEPDFARVHQELLRHKHVTKLLLWHEYIEQNPNGYQYSQFCERYNAWQSQLGVTMRQVHKAGEKMFVDFSGDSIDIIDPHTGECRAAKLFVAVLGASNLTYVEPVLTEDLPTWIGCHVRAWSYFGGVASITVPDNLKSGVTKPDYYDPELNPTYADVGQHYGTAIIPARVRRPRDKAKVEQGVLLAERWVLAVLRHRQFTSLGELAAAIAPLLERLNDRRMRKLDMSRRELFEAVERAALLPLPQTPYEFAHWKKARVNIDYHVEYDGHYYSVPHVHARALVEVRATEATVEVLRARQRIASHPRSRRKHGHTTRPEHMPASHRRYAEWTPSRIIAWAQNVGPNTAHVVEEIMRRRAHPEQGFRSCLGIMGLRKLYPDERIERACARASTYRTYSRKSIVAILKNNLDAQDHREMTQMALPLHENIRGPRYYL